MRATATNSDTPCPSCGSVALTRANQHAAWHCAGCGVRRDSRPKNQWESAQYMFSSGYEHLADGSARISRGYRAKDGSWVESSEVVPARPEPEIAIINSTSGRIDRVERRTTADGDQVVVLLEAVVEELRGERAKERT